MGRYGLYGVTVFFLLAAVLPAADEDEGDKAKLQGTWKLVAVEKDGGKPQKVTNKSTDYFELKFAGDKVTATFKQGTSEKGTHKIDPSQKPKTINFMPTTSDDKGKTLLGIYELKGNTLKMCVAEPEIKKRPKEFKSKGEGVIVYELQRVKS
jgi:uncharacterized protein (TIGR03067 family)